ncbi:MAG: tRNA (N(6)-L-threonylcarbamoyladenosine(37)-C(2))-methylthiotransferase MtaB [Bacteroidetes bacterium]|nr:MAG: tRNA (N(6)-L-threonylcarbamoyladenosine(37)-C(2))-methylthiotransferase MtaB [Bacteroidota bacterium]
MKRKIAFKTLGCRLNQFETDSVLTDFFRSGYEVVGFHEPADVYVVNTCTVTNQGDQKSRTAINQAVRGKAGSLVVVTGCMAVSQKQYLESRGDISYVVDNKSKARILPLVEAHFNGEILAPDVLNGNVFGYTVAEKSFHTRSMIKIQDGCDNFCTFCIVPMVRGRAVSRSLVDILENIRQVIGLGYREIVLTGVNISRYEHEGTNFVELLSRILEVEGDFRVRISSVEPEGFGDPLYDLFSHGKLCPHLHLCLQSGSDRILMRMRRNYSLDSYLGIIEQLRKRYPLFNFTTDIMVGFPGETEDDFRETCRVVRQEGFSHVHTFRYSIRMGTRAERMDGQVPEKEKQERSNQIREIAAGNKLQYRRQFIGKQQTVLVEKTGRNSLAKGYGEHYVPVEFRPKQPGTNYFETVAVKEILSSSSDFVLKA